jgi:type II secretory pathway pseudopilin PulG
MKNILGFLLRSQFKSFKQTQTPNGFTLIELLVAMLLAFLVITPLMGFMIDLMNTERREQAKTTSEQEIQAALDYIAQDMQQAVYIYDADGIDGKTSPAIAGIKGQIPSGTDRVPVLVFWKRSFLNKSQSVALSSTTAGVTTTSNETVGCLVKLPSSTTCNNQDYMVYSLVAYYLVKDSSTTWNSTTARIARWEIRDGIRDISGTQTRSETVGSTTTTVKYLVLPDKGFMPFNISLTGDLGTKLGNWTKHSEAYTNSLNTLVDWIDQTRNTNVSPAPASCNSDEQQVPNYSATGFSDTFKTGSFYACVNAKKYVARVYIRGNAMARIQSGAQYNSQQSIYFPTASIQVKGRGFLGVE